MNELPMRTEPDGQQTTRELDMLHHIAIEVRDIDESVRWYQSLFRCDVSYQDDTWALLKFSNLHMALVLPGHHPPHCGFVTDRAGELGELKEHRDGTRSIYISDPSGNSVELLEDNEAVRKL